MFSLPKTPKIISCEKDATGKILRLNAEDGTQYEVKAPDNATLDIWETAVQAHIGT